MHPKHLQIADFTYNLPNERIAKFPLQQRDASRLLLYKNGQISDTAFSHIAEHLPENSLLVFNNSKVIEARLLMAKPTGGIIEIFALEPHEKYADITTAMNATGHILYKCLVGGAAKWKHGILLQKQVGYNNEEIEIKAALVEKRTDCFIIELTWTPAHLSFAEVLHAAGKMPIPPYLNRDADISDDERYQTIYAKADGSVAAPTAGLHFTPEVLATLAAKNIQQSFTTLHVGAGTFMPVKSDTMQGHSMHAEYIDVNMDLIEHLIANDTIIAVGTTSTRTLESLYWMGLKVYLNEKIQIHELEIKQWEIYDLLIDKSVNKKTALSALVNWLRQNGLQQLIIKTQIIIAPGYPFKIVRGLITNFHQPQSTLLLLVSALVGDDWKKIYTHAMQHGYRFLSYGDSSLLLP